MTEISVVIPTRNRAALLGKCLTSLCEQTLDPSRFEICVVDNGSTDMTAKVVALVNVHYPKHHIFRVEEPKLGVAYARNMGVQNTDSPLIVQGEDDTISPSDWLERFLVAFNERGQDVGKIGGNIIPVWVAPRPVWLVDEMLPLLSATSGLDNIPHYVTEGILAGNSCYRRKALDTAGRFPTMLGRKGNNLLASEYAVDYVIKAQGHKIYYDPSIVISHTLLADRLTPEWARRRYFWLGVSDHAVRVYLKTKEISVALGDCSVEMPFDASHWTFVNDANELPNQEKLGRLRSLGFVLANSGFIPIN